MMKPMTIEGWLDIVDRARMSREIGISQPQITRAKRAGHFPAYWYAAIRDWAAGEGVPLPDHLFNFHVAPPPPEPLAEASTSA